MIAIFDNFFKEDELLFYKSLWDDSKIEFSNKAIHFYSVDILPIKNKLWPANYLLNHNFAKLKIQKYDSTFTQIDNYHGHKDLFNIIIYLNDNFKGGNLKFEIGLNYKPKSGTLVYFNGNEFHKVTQVKEGTRFCIVGSCNYDILSKILLNDIKKQKFL